jgi:hypothetical protein
LKDTKGVINPNIKKLNPDQLLYFIYTLLDEYRKLHYATPKSDVVTAHLDTKGLNLLAYFIWNEKDPSKLEKFAIKIIDFGFSKFQQIDNLGGLEPIGFNCNGSYFPDESKKGWGGVKSDVWQLASQLAFSLGDDQAESKKEYFQSDFTRLRKFDFF